MATASSVGCANGVQRLGVGMGQEGGHYVSMTTLPYHCGLGRCYQRYCMNC